MRLVLDTNVMLVILSPKSKHRWIFDKFLAGEITFCLTTDIFDEYAEIIGTYMGEEAVESLTEVLHTNLTLYLWPNTIRGI